MTKNRFITARDITDYSKLNRNKVSYRTVCRVLSKLNLPPHKQHKKFWLGGKNGIATQLKWATLISKRLKRDPSHLDSVIFSDESILI